jgi:hypothetical protein
MSLASNRPQSTLLTDLLLRTCHSARRTRNRRHPANLDPEPSLVGVCFAETESMGSGNLSLWLYLPYAPVLFEWSPFTSDDRTKLISTLLESSPGGAIRRGCAGPSFAAIDVSTSPHTVRAPGSGLRDARFSPAKPWCSWELRTVFLADYLVTEAFRRELQITGCRRLLSPKMRRENHLLHRTQEPIESICYRVIPQNLSGKRGLRTGTFGT